MSTPDRDQLANALMMQRGSMIACQDMTPPLSDYRAADMILEMFAPALRSARAEAWDEAAEEITEWSVTIRYQPHGNGQSDPPVNPYLEAGK